MRRHQIIAALNEAREIHQHWADDLANPSVALKVDPRPRKKVVGGIRWHKRWIRVYDAAIDALKQGH